MTNKPMLSVERADFEKEVQAKAERFQPDFRRYGDHPEADYKCATNQWAWELWQKRASMNKPAAQHQGKPVAWVIDTADGHGADYYPGKGLDTLELGANLYAEPPAKHQGEPVAIERLNIQMLKGGLFRYDSDPDGVLVRYQDHAEQVERLRLEVARLNRVKLALAEKVTAHADNCAGYRAQLSEQPAPAAVALNSLAPFRAIIEKACDEFNNCCARADDAGEAIAAYQGLRSMLDAWSAECPVSAPVAVVMPFAEKVISKLQRFEACASDGQGADIGRHWFDILTQIGLLNRVQRSPAYWEITQQGEDVLQVARLNGVQP